MFGWGVDGVAAAAKVGVRGGVVQALVCHRTFLAPHWEWGGAFVDPHANGDSLGDRRRAILLLA